MTNENKLTIKEIVNEFAAMAKEFYIAEVMQEEEDLKIKFLNGQSFTVSVRENQ